MTLTIPPAVVVTDLDGTLLDHDSYDWTPAQPALLKLQERGIPVVFNTSKTEPETRVLQKRMGLSGPFIVENGSCIQTEDGPSPLGRDRAEIKAWLDRANICARFQCDSFSGLGIEGIMASTGLSEEGARLAAERAWSEPLRWSDSDAALAQFKTEAHAAGFRLLRGGRFVHVIGDCDKGQATRQLVEEYATKNGGSQALPRIVALGDSANDCAMLRVAQRPIWVRRRGVSAPQCEPPIPAAEYTKEVGPAGWNASILALIDEGYFDG